MNSLKRHLSKFSVLRSPFSVPRLKLNTLFRLTFILLLGGAGLAACANLQTVSYAEQLKTDAEQGDAAAQVSLGRMYAEILTAPLVVAEFAEAWHGIWPRETH